ncbi:unnamed protein product [Rotaria sp. Silwood2]|nr:unnamed protein product [Rotaria sp. Silwood2]
MSKLQKLYETKRFSRLIIDEVHCVSQFGHDFRPDYKYLSIFKRQFPNLPILGLTATATLKVIHDIRKILQISNCILFRAPFNRKNLFYEVYHKPNVGKDALSDLVHCIQRRFDQQSDIKAGCYHAGLSSTARTQVHEQWLKNQVHVICATIAFGMGIDKPDVRFVIHHSLSKSIENFYQESGRAGRDDQQSYCILFFRFADVFRLAPMAFSDKSGNGLKNLYSMISYCLNESQCRRKLIAKYFDEVWQSNDCNQMCDICTRSSISITKRNCREEALIIINYLSDNKKERITAIKLIEKLSIKTMTKLDLQRLILQLIIDQYLKENFRFTSYATICYIKLGPRSECIKNEKCQILLDIVDSTKNMTAITNKKNEKQINKKKSSTSTVTERRRKLHSVTNKDPDAKPIQRKKRTLEYDDDNDDNDNNVENIPISKKQNTLSSDGRKPIKCYQLSVSDNEELDCS